MDDHEPSRTAVLVAQARAISDGRTAVGRFADSVAAMLLRETETEPVQQIRNGVTPSNWRDRIRNGIVQAAAGVLVPRTVAIDDAIVERGHPQLVILGAGLDARAWRLPELASTTVYEVDHPASQADKRSRIEELSPTAKRVVFVPVDFGRDSMTEALAEAGHDASVPTTWVWEGVLDYLTQEQVDSTLDAVTGRSAPGSRLVATYPSPAKTDFAKPLMRLIFRLSSREHALKHERHISTWSPGQMHTLLDEHGFRVERDRTLVTVSQELDLPVVRPEQLGNSHVVVADKA